MIDTHCHLEQPDYDIDRDAVIEKCKRELDAVITSCADPNDFELTMQMVKKYPKFVFATASVHPEYVRKFSDDEIDKAINVIEANASRLVAIGETGLDYSWVKDDEGRKRQKEMFVKFIRLAKRLKLPIIVHIRQGPDKDHKIFEDTIGIMEQEKTKRAQMHMFGSRQLRQRVLDNGWLISTNAIVMRSKNYKKLIRDTPLDGLMLETDAPWLHPSGLDKDKQRNDPTGVRAVAEKVAEIKKITLEEVDKQTTKNAIKFFKLSLTNL